MPIYEYWCPAHGIFEKYSPRVLEDDDEFTNCKDLKCPRAAKRQVSLVSMHPDKYWSGQIVQGEYVTSEKEAKELTKNLVPDSRENREYIQRKKIQNRREEAEKKANNLEKFLSKELQGVTADPDYNHVLSNKVRKVQIK